MCKEGDTKFIWDPENRDEVEAARSHFNELVKEKKFSAFEVTTKGNKAKKRVDDFDPSLGKLILVPPIAGG